MASTVLITGGSQGIGRATALLFANKGFDLVLAARHADQLEVTAQEVQSLGRAAIAVPTDVRDPDQVNTLVQKALDHYGAIDVLINNAGIYLSGPIEQFSLSDWHYAMDTNFWGYVHTIQALLPQFLKRGTGSIVNVGSIGGKVPIPYLTPYCASKYAVTGLTEALQAEVAPKGIQVCGIYPNLIKSNFVERAVFRGTNEQEAEARRDQLNQLLTAPVIETPEDVAQAIWSAIKHQHSEAMVGSANVSRAAYRLFPGLMQWIFRRTFER